MLKSLIFTYTKEAISWLSFTNEIRVKHQKVQQNIAVVTKYSPRVSSFTCARFRVDRRTSTSTHAATRRLDLLIAWLSLGHQHEPKGTQRHQLRAQGEESGSSPGPAAGCGRCRAAPWTAPAAPTGPRRSRAGSEKTPRCTPLVWVCCLGVFFLFPAAISFVFNTDWLAKFSKHRTVPSGTRNRRAVGHWHCICLVHLYLLCNHFNVNHIFPIIRQIFLFIQSRKGKSL